MELYFQYFVPKIVTCVKNAQNLIEHLSNFTGVKPRSLQ